MFTIKTTITVDYYLHMYGFRPASFFIEPSYYAAYCTPFICILLFDKSVKHIGIFNKKTTKFIFAIFLTLTVLLSTSSLGVVMCTTLWVVYLFRGQKNAVAKIVTTAIILFGLFLITYSDIFLTTVNRFLSGSSIGPRVLRGFIIFSKESVIEKIFGVGLNNIGNYVEYFSISTPYDESDLNYTVTLTNRLISTGLLGTFSLVYFWLNQFLYNKNPTSKVLLLLILISFVFANGEYTCDFAFAFIVASSFDKIKVSSNQNRITTENILIYGKEKNTIVSSKIF